MSPGARNIPAHAGKTHGETIRGVDSGEHPRARGENLTPTNNITVTLGTSPRTRGKLSYWIDYEERHRNIPAHAGKTLLIVYFFACVGEHPRARGENQAS